MPNNKLSDLNNHLFLALERLNDDELDITKLELEEKRVKAIASISNQIISVSTLVYKAAVSIGKGDIDPSFIPNGFDVKKIGNANDNS